MSELNAAISRHNLTAETFALLHIILKQVSQIL